ncbi:hypothetical protein GCM10019071_19420 [Sphingobium fuliginis]|uniref:Uncharacterized protein n=2 Tax=Sphingomonadaceae TaxID=41297 RepID=A0ABQ1EWX0_SPHSA|nr:hypothetical protein GCM10019071_19420 [Sphingobium fuliginis]
MRLAPYSKQLRDAETNEFLGILDIAFQIRPEDKGGLSCTWVEHYGEKSHATLSVAARAYRDSLPSKKIGNTAYFAMGTAGQVRSKSAEYGKQIRIVHAPDGPNTGHVELHQFSDEDRRLLDALAREVFTEHIAVTELDMRP